MTARDVNGASDVMEILITSSTLTVYSDVGASIAQWPLAHTSAEMLLEVIDAVRRNDVAWVEKLFASAGESAK